MQIHPYHQFFLPILVRLYETSDIDKYIDITDCLSGTSPQKLDILRQLNESRFAWARVDTTLDILTFKTGLEAYSAIILPLGIQYVQQFLTEYMETKEVRKVGFR
jgi:hypothetical protein